MTLHRRALLGAALATPCLARAQGRFPERPITILVPFPAGGATDVQMRALAEAATRHFGQTVLTENRPGAGSTLGAAAVARARPDGYLLAQMTLPALRLPFMQRMAYDPRRDFTPVVHLTGYTFGVLVRAESPWRSWPELVADARARPGRHRWGNTGANGTPHLTMVELAEREKLEVEHVPFRGEADAVPSLLGGHIEAAAAGSGAAPLVLEGKLRYLNFWTPKRLAKFPDVPTLVDLGYQGMVVTSPYGLVAPAGLDPAILAALAEGFRRAVHDPVHLAALDRLDQTLEYLGPEEYARNMAETIDMEEARVKRLGLSTG
ncbi:tripartite tricarboxylate transporter substrate binding protein [Siccirubricoccus sp. KC 17139]|uniref:Tripartite tricarboxylate transporter substrate binding protein n=1 Tax=Siccirubricoccus soli TaxID=2899147 RepID=A0ABT1D005_9PROT|nr:tripartite tricarboxylate transporter substrate binding protein [Siccirubricoccus soli]MCO6414584.1 tripartite tricarboxylate transporter substrate binding protein [Siccirubricoccus soli]MCP2680714.1 tripartite tricarboxylate transporter substrate binding protein [Siccirubricoccus soli]